MAYLLPWRPHQRWATLPLGFSRLPPWPRPLVLPTSTNCCCCCRRRRPLFPRRFPCLHHYTMADAVFLTGMKPPTVTIFVCPKNSELNWSITIFDIKFESIWHFLQPTSLTLISNCREHCYKNGFWSQFKNVSERWSPCSMTLPTACTLDWIKPAKLKRWERSFLLSVPCCSSCSYVLLAALFVLLRLSRVSSVASLVLSLCHLWSFLCWRYCFSNSV